ncbi:hypothetical protein [Microbacterium sp. SORGH_AS_0862]|nr:hypothetical protein [Microbacterium sp. SORGH_AS_0862]MDQ1205088.1 hypothetical protein [Microbacterium sp. SORGH_AS_0862]
MRRNSVREGARAKNGEIGGKTRRMRMRHAPDAGTVVAAKRLLQRF